MNERAQVWSDELHSATRAALIPVPVTAELCVKHSTHGFGILTVPKGLDGPLQLVERRKGTTHTFADADVLIAAGWVID